MSDQPAEARPEDLVAACRRLYSAIDKLDARAAALAGVSRNDLRCLNMLAQGPAKPREIRAELGLTSGSVTTLLDRLEKAGLAERNPDPHDRRGVLVNPTQLLFETLGPLYSNVARKIADMGALYSPDERTAAVRHFNEACVAFETAERSV